MTVLVVTGTGTAVGKTVVSAAVASLAVERGARVAYVKPAQTGVADPGPTEPSRADTVAAEPSDADVVRRLAGLDPVDTYELARYPDPLSPAAAARRCGRAPVDLVAVAERVRELAADYRLVLVEGAGGLLVRYDEDGTTIADLARLLAAPVLLVTAAGLGTLNHTALTLEALAHRGLELAGLVIGAWPAEPDLAALSNVTDLEMLAARPLSGALTELGCAASTGLGGAPFADIARQGLAPALGGRFDPAEFRARASPRPEDAP